MRNLYTRIFISITDVAEAIELLEKIPDCNNRIIKNGVFKSAIIALVRPFKNSKGSNNVIRALPKEYLNDLSQDSKNLFMLAEKQRDKIFAHSDDEFYNAKTVLAGEVPGVSYCHLEQTKEITRYKDYLRLAIELRDLLIAHRDEVGKGIKSITNKSTPINSNFSNISSK